MRSYNNTDDLLKDLNLRIIGAVLNHAERKYSNLYYCTLGRYQPYYYRSYTCGGYDDKLWAPRAARRPNPTTERKLRGKSHHPAGTEPGFQTNDLEHREDIS